MTYNVFGGTLNLAQFNVITVEKSFCSLFFFIIVVNIMFACSPNFFILDEPTNHLDMETIEALGRALQKFQASVLPCHMNL